MGDSSILSSEYDTKKTIPEDQRRRITLKGLKPGETTLSFLSRKDMGKGKMKLDISTTPVRVLVESKDSGGCNTGFFPASLWLLGLAGLFYGKNRL